MKLLETDIQTKEVLEWRGLHLLHFRHSACSQKTRIFLKLKGIEWQSHHVNLASQDNYKDWYLGINPRGLVPVLVHDGVVHIESNDILQYLEATFPTPELIPKELSDTTAQHLKEEDDLHMDLRAITMGFLSPRSVVTKKDTLLANYQDNQGTLQGESDEHKAREIKFWRDFAEQGVTEHQALAAAERFSEVFQRFDAVLGRQSYLFGDEITLVDIAWYIYTFRLSAAGYPFSTLHPNVFKWFQDLNAKPEFYAEVSQPWVMSAAIKTMQFFQTIKGQSLVQVMRRGGLC